MSKSILIIGEFKTRRKDVTVGIHIPTDRLITESDIEEIQTKFVSTFNPIKDKIKRYIVDVVHCTNTEEEKDLAISFDNISYNGMVLHLEQYARIANL